MSHLPETRYARSDGVHVAFQTWGAGPADLAVVLGGISNLELVWHDPPSARAYDRLGAVARVIAFDKRGTGLSDRVPFSSALDVRMDDIRAVLDELGSEQAFLFGESEGATLAALYAATYPARVAGLVLYAPLVRMLTAPDFPWAHEPEVFEAFLEHSAAHWGDGSTMGFYGPARAGDPVAQEFWGRFERQALSPGGYREHLHVMAQIDIRAVLPTIDVPTLVVHRRGDPAVPIGQGRYVAEHVRGARILELDGADHRPFEDDGQVAAAIEEFVTGQRPVSRPGRHRLTTVLFTDIVESTRSVARLGDHRWHELLDAHDAAVRELVAQHRGRVVKSTGDGVLACFDGPARAVQCAAAIRLAVQRLGIEIRAGLHCGEVEQRGSDVTGLTVHIAARAEGVATSGQIVVTDTVVDLVPGSGLAFDELGEHELRGIDGRRRLYALSGAA